MQVSHSALVDSLALSAHQLADSPYRDTITAVTVAFFARLWVKAFDALATNGILDQVSLSRSHADQVWCTKLSL